MKLKITKQISTKLSEKMIWLYLEKAFKNSQDSYIWPSGIESLKSVRGIDKNSVIHVQDKMLFGNKKFRYTVVRFKPEDSFVLETSPEHPLKGFILVEIKPSLNELNNLIFDVDLETKKFTPWHIIEFRNFFNKFFPELEKKIRGEE